MADGELTDEAFGGLQECIDTMLEAKDASLLQTFTPWVLSKDTAMAITVSRRAVAATTAFYHSPSVRSANTVAFLQPDVVQTSSHARLSAERPVDADDGAAVWPKWSDRFSGTLGVDTTHYRSHTPRCLGRHLYRTTRGSMDADR